MYITHLQNKLFQLQKISSLAISITSFSLTLLLTSCTYDFDKGTWDARSSNKKTLYQIFSTTLLLNTAHSSLDLYPDGYSNVQMSDSTTETLVHYTDICNFVEFNSEYNGSHSILELTLDQEIFKDDLQFENFFLVNPYCDFYDFPILQSECFVIETENGFCQFSPFMENELLISLVENHCNEEKISLIVPFKAHFNYSYFYFLGGDLCSHCHQVIQYECKEIINSGLCYAPHEKIDPGFKLKDLDIYKSKNKDHSFKHELNEEIKKNLHIEESDDAALAEFIILISLIGICLIALCVYLICWLFKKREELNIVNFSNLEMTNLNLNTGSTNS